MPLERIESYWMKCMISGKGSAFKFEKGHLVCVEYLCQSAVTSQPQASWNEFKGNTNDFTKHYC